MEKLSIRSEKATVITGLGIEIGFETQSYINQLVHNN